MPSTQTAKPEGELLVGGQALIEGVMMRSPGAYGVAVRRPDGSLALQRGKVPSLSRRYPVFKLPLVRGIGVLFQSLAIGIRALNFSAEQAIAAAGAADGAAAPADRDRSAPNGPAPARPAADRSSWAVAGSMAFGLGLGALVFLLLPLWLTQLAERHLFGPLSGLGFNLLDGGLRALFFLAYLYGISRLRDIHRVFMYHGAQRQAQGHGAGNRPARAVSGGRARARRVRIQRGASWRGGVEGTGGRGGRSRWRAWRPRRRRVAAGLGGGDRLLGGEVERPDADGQ